MTPSEKSAWKILLEFGNHKPGCDRPEGDWKTKHICCSCGWCVEKDWAEMMIGNQQPAVENKCNCGVSAGIRTDHEAECAVAYLHENTGR